MKTAITRAVLLFAALCLLLTACQSGGKDSGQQLAAHVGKDPNRPKLTLCVDLNPGFEASESGPVFDFLKTVPGYLDDFSVELDRIPCQGTERDTALTRVKTELLSGAGPDLFICVSPNLLDVTLMEKHQNATDALFQFPRSAMELGFFLPLDDYIAKAQYMEWDKLLPVVMDAGKSEKGQLLLPLTYSISATLAERESRSLTASLPMTWDEMLVSEDPCVRFACYSWRFGSILGELGDYGTDSLTFTEEELFARLEEARAANLAGRPQELGEANDVMPSISIGASNAHLFTPKSPEYIMIPQYNTTGGVTANINSFAAVNANTRHPDEAFLIVDKLLDQETMSNCEIYAYGSALPVNLELCQKDAPYYASYYEQNGKPRTEWYMNQWNYQQTRELAGQVNSVNFVTPLNQELMLAYGDCLNEEDPEKRRELTAEHYTAMKMMIAES